MSKITVGTTLFGVTNHNYVVAMAITEINPVGDDNNDDFSVIRVKPVDDSSFAEAQVRLVFNDLLLVDNEVNKSTVFLEEQDAKDFALKYTIQKEESLLRELDALRKHKAQLQQ